MRLTILGGGGFRVPLVHRALLADEGPGRVTDLVLHDLDAGRLRTIGRVLEDATRTHGGAGPRVHLETDLETALAGADFVFSAIRVGGLAGRVCDERSALDLGVLGQETTGAGGVCYGLRTVPVAMQIAETVRRVAPEAYVINFTNPAGMVTEAMSRILGDRVVGICDSPVGMFKRVARALGVSPDEAVFDYAGLNHLGWLRRVTVAGEDLLPGLLADPAALLRTEEGRLFGPDWLATLGAVPNEYLWYWYYRSDAVAAEQAAGHTRGELLLEQQQEFWAEGPGAPGEAFAGWEQARLQREATYMAESREATGAGEREQEDLDGGGYDRVALQLMRAIARDEATTLILNVPNRGTIAGLDTDAVVEVPCSVDAQGWRPHAVDPLDPHAFGLVSTMKAVERTTVQAALSGSYATATKALALHPLVGSVTVARGILDSQLTALPELRSVLR
ncbi:6-phospho-beta-glucosidase [Nocardioides mesophilus]|uniref:6-phospho-beta-glucosidase n=1 Tax=Nocardioides mesophilus TaxID=433659 RepID=A0A7G9RF00_9ACTN|nr:6-phospho-beta-glucosidase [Nocardioides mesophilus]QNN54175.1 6-phospho-beta-glucosidase [Nocardioides mesophilus]